MKRKIACPNCGQSYTRILETDVRKSYTRRRRACRECGYRWSTYEISALEFKALPKRDELLLGFDEIIKHMTEEIAKVSMLTKKQFGIETEES